MTAPLLDGQYALDDLVLGDGTAYRVTTFEDGGLPGRRTQDTANAYDDGWRPGRDLFDGMTCSLEAIVETAGGVDSWDAVRAMRQTWRGDAVRGVAGAVQVLRRKVPGMPTRRVYGRSRACTPVMSRRSGVGLVPVVAEFSCVDDRWYADEPTVEVLPIVPASTTGFSTTGTGFVFPLSTAAVTARPGELVNDGDVSTWPVLTIRGPVSQPSLELVVDGARVWLLEFPGTLEDGESVTIDARPWARTVLRENGATWKRTAASSSLRAVQVPPGVSSVVFRGSSTSGTATAEVRFESAYAGG